MGLSIAANAFLQAPSAGEAASLLPNYNLLDPESAAVLGANLVLLQEVVGLSDAAYFLDQIGEGRFSSLNPDQREKFLGALSHFIKTIPAETWKRLQWFSGSGELGARRHLRISTRRFSDDPRTVLKNSLVDRVTQRLGVDGTAVFASAGDPSAAIRQSGNGAEESLTGPDAFYLLYRARKKANQKNYTLAAKMMVSLGLKMESTQNGAREITPEACFREAAGYYEKAAEDTSQGASGIAAGLLRRMAASYLADGQWFDAEEGFFRSQQSRLEEGLDATQRVTAEKMTVLMRAKATMEIKDKKFASEELEDILREMKRLNMEIEWTMPPQLRFARAHTEGSLGRTLQTASSLYSKEKYSETAEYYRSAFWERLEIMEPVFVKMVLKLLGDTLGTAFLRRFYSEQTLQATLDFLKNQPRSSVDVKRYVKESWTTEKTPPLSFQDALSIADKAMSAGLMIGEQGFPVVTLDYGDARRMVSPTDLFLRATRYFRMARQYQSVSPEARNTPLHIPLKGAVAYMFAGNFEKAFSILSRYIDVHRLARGHLPSEPCSREGEAPTALPLEGATQAPIIEQNPVIKRVMGAMVAEIAPRTFEKSFALAWTLLGTYDDDARLPDEIRTRNASDFPAAREEAVKAQRLSDTGNLPAAEEKFAFAVSRMRRIADPKFAAQIMDLLGDRMGQAFLRFFYEEEAYREVWKIVAPWVRHSDDEVQPLPLPQLTLRELVDNALAKKELTDDTLKAMAKEMSLYRGKPVDPGMLRQHLVVYGDLFTMLADKAGFRTHERYQLSLALRPLAVRTPLKKP